jgi:hypothetical protein
MQQICALSPNRLPSLNRQKQKKLLIDRKLAIQMFQAQNLGAKIRPTAADAALLKQKLRFMNQGKVESNLSGGRLKARPRHLIKIA